MFRRTSPLLAAALAAVVLGGCSSCASYRRCSPPEPQILRELPARLKETALFGEASGSAPSAHVRHYEPAFPLWSDGTDKRRWIELPPGARIDTSDFDDWRFPVGTRLFKEFARDGRRLETRVLFKWGPDDEDWTGAAYVWLEDQSDALLTPAGARDVDGEHDVPSAAECTACHGGRRSRVLGFSALQLGAAEGSASSLEALERAGLLSDPVAEVAIGRDDTERRALGYLHANCGHCHNARRPPRGDGARCYDPERTLDLSLTREALGPGQVPPALRTAVPEWITPGEPEQSRLLSLLGRRGARLHMPPLATERVDPAGVALIGAWIASLPGGAP